MLSFLNRFRKKKAEKKTDTENVSTMSDLEQLCGDDKETYEALRHVMFLDPRKVGFSMKEAAESAKRFEKENDLMRATVFYEIAGGLAVYEGNVKKVAEFFSESERISPDQKKYPILKNPAKAVAKAQEYYKTHLKT